MAKVYRYDLNESLEAMSMSLRNKSMELPLSDLSIKDTKDSCTVTLGHSYKAVYGMGERYNQVNQKGLTVRIEVIEKFCNQGAISYCPIPFFFTDHNFGVFVDTFTVTEFTFEDEIKIKINRDSNHRLPILYFFGGKPGEIISEYTKLTGLPSAIPKWSLAPWMSANRWNTEEEVIKQVELAEQHQFPHGTLVIEAWSDEATFYRFNEHDEWKDPKELVRALQDKGIRLILWQIPVLKKMDHGEKHEVLDQDWEYAIEHNLCIKNLDGTPYTIPTDHWFAGSLLPDFTNPATVKWWFEKRQYLLDMGVSGFKTDGGEFVLTDEVIAANGSTGLEMRNQFVASYLEEYTKFIGKDRVLFSRAGFKGQQNYPIQWAGDQMSTWEELRHVLIAGLSIGLSGVPFWGFDIGGFAGAMPTARLYERATQLSVFAPVMQWHSEPAGGQFAELYPTTGGNNDRSPWNISKLYQDNSLMDRLRYQYNLRMNLLPYLYNEALHSEETGRPMMKHLILEYPEDEMVRDSQDLFMLGDLLIAPILEEDQNQRKVYLPEGTWTGLWAMEAEEIDMDEIDIKEVGNKEIDNKEIDNKEIDNKEIVNKDIVNIEIDNKDIVNNEKVKEVIVKEYLGADKDFKNDFKNDFRNNIKNKLINDIEEDKDKEKASDIENDSMNIRLKGGYSYLIKSGQGRIPVFIRDGGCLALNLNSSLTLGSDVGNDTSKYRILCFYPVGTEGEYHFGDEEGNDLLIRWKDGIHEAKQLSGNTKFLILNKI